MQLIHTVRGIPVSVKEVYTGPARNVVERVERMFSHLFGFGDLKMPTDEAVALVKEAAKEMARVHHERHEEAEDAIAAFKDNLFFVRWFLKPPAPYADYTEQETLAAYRERFQTFLNWLILMNRSSRFYCGQLNGEIAACGAIIQALLKEQR
jgi:hypothetical protein